MSAKAGCQLSCDVGGGFFSIHSFPGTAWGRKMIELLLRLARNASRVPPATDNRANARSVSIRALSSDFKSPASKRSVSARTLIVRSFHHNFGTSCRRNTPEGRRSLNMKYWMRWKGRRNEATHRLYNCSLHGRHPDLCSNTRGPRRQMGRSAGSGSESASSCSQHFEGCRRSLSRHADKSRSRRRQDSGGQDSADRRFGSARSEGREWNVRGVDKRGQDKAQRHVDTGRT